MFEFFRTRTPVETLGPTSQIAPDDPTIQVLVTVLSAEPEKLQKAIRDHGSKPGRRAVFVITDPDVRTLVQNRLTFEHLPAPAIVRAFGDTGDWSGYLHESWRILHVKWTPRWIINYGQNFDEYLEKCGL